MELFPILRQNPGFTLGNKLSKQHPQFQKHKMNAKFLCCSSCNRLPKCVNETKLITKFKSLSKRLTCWTHEIPWGKDINKPFVQHPKMSERNPDVNSNILAQSEDQYWCQATSFDTPTQTFVIGFLASIKSTIEMANEMFSTTNPFKYLLTYKYSQDHIELLFSCIRARWGWNHFELSKFPRCHISQYHTIFPHKEAQSTFK